MNKEIMEIIQPYTDKTLSEGCYINIWSDYDLDLIKICDNPKVDKSGWICILYFQSVKEIDHWHYKELQVCNHKMSLDNIEELNKHIYWHYSISAIERYLISRNKNSNYIKCEIIDSESSDNPRKIYNINWKEYIIPNKPPHLFNERQNKDLLKWLKELCNN